MILDSLQNARLYEKMHPSFPKAFEYLINTDFSVLENGKYEIEGNTIFAMVNRYETKPAESLKWEAHKKYIDIQLVVSGEEKIGVQAREKMNPVTDYDGETDVYFFEGGGNTFVLSENTFAVIFPHEAHKPGILLHETSSVKKIVVKVKL